MTHDRQRLFAGILVAVSLAYLWTFVPRGWVPHDEGMLGEAAERVRLGNLPHVDYQEMYTGGLSLLHSLAFRVFGSDLLHLRWVLYGAAALGQILIYAILRRFAEPVGAAFASVLALTWSFPNYFASLPSWWVLLCAVACVWAFIRYTETELLRYAALAGLAAGLSIAFKQTGLYVLVALVMALLYGRGHRIVRIGMAVGGTGLAAVILRPALTSSESVYLMLPIVASGTLLAASRSREADTADAWTATRAVALAVLCAAVPLVALLVPYMTAARLETLVNGLFILPQKRLEFTRLPMTHAYFILAGVPCVALVTPFARRIRLSEAHTRVWLFGLSLVALAVIAAGLHRYAAYQLIWQSGRGFATLLPVVVSGLLLTRHDLDPKRGRILFGTTVMLAWASLVQFPFSGAIYFCYAAPLAVIAGAASARHFSPSNNPALAVWCAALTIFAVVTMNRGYLDSLGAWHQPMAFETRLDIPRAHLDVRADDAALYRRIAQLVSQHLGRGRLVAGPDSPEVYFLVDRLSPSGASFDFFSSELAGEDAAWTDAQVVVLNHRPGFSHAPSAALTSSVRHVFPSGETVGRFEVRWR
jgi:hypothetical protein